MSAAIITDAITRAETHKPEPPRPLQRELPPAKPFPVDALGSLLGDAARAIHDQIQAPLAICGQSVLAVATLATQGHADVELPTEAAAPLSNFFISVAASGERKSAVDRLALWPIRKREESLRLSYEADLADHENAKAAWDKSRDRVLKSNEAQDTKSELDALGRAPSAPLHPMLVASEPTLEGLTKMLANGQPSVGVFSGEGGAFIGGHAMSDESKLRSGALLSALWDGDPIRRARSGDGIMFLCGRRVSLHLMVQPGAAQRLLSDQVLTDQGTLSRLLVVAPDSAAGMRLWKEPSPQSDLDLKRYGARLLSILETPFVVAEDRPNELTPRRLTLAPAARSLWIAFADEIETQVGRDGALHPIRGLANKLPEHAARIAGVLMLTEDLRAGEVSSDAMAAGIVLAQHYADEALRLFEAGAMDPDIALADRLLAWLRTGWEHDLVSLPDMYQRGPNGIRNGKTAKKLVQILEEHGWLHPVPTGADVAGVRRREAWRIVGRA